MRIDLSKMTHVKTLLIGIKGLGVPVQGTLKIMVIIDTYPRCLTL
jgi:hypothetical protein